jgi:uncharacterized protein with beta-barrel porin domain
MRGRLPTAPSRLHLWLTSTSLAALMIGGGAPAALAAPCINTITGNFDNAAAHTVANVCVRNTSFTGNITNEGTISPSGIAFVNGTITGFIRSNGVINGGISLDATSKISGTATDIQIHGPGTFAGGLTNAGSIISTARSGIAITGVPNFAGGVTNIGTINAHQTGLFIATVSTFSGGVTNSGTISSAIGSGMSAFNVRTFAGDMVNTGTILAGGTNGMAAIGMSTFAGSIANSGSIRAQQNGIAVGSANAANRILTFTGGVTNSGTVTALTKIGITIDNVSTFLGGITNSGTVVAGRTGVFLANIAAFSGGIANRGTITAGSSGVVAFQVSTFVGGMTNSGTIVAHNSGMFAQTISVFSGGMTNSGTISSSAESGMYAFTVSTFSGGMTNSGTINAHNAGMYAKTISVFSGDMLNTGTISAGGSGLGVLGIATFAGGVMNAGSISAGTIGIDVNGVGSLSGGVANAGTGHITAAHTGVLVTNVSNFAGGLINAGAITSATKFGVAINTVSTFAGGITNAGSISAGTIGIDVTAVGSLSGGVANAGTGRITAAQTGLLLSTISNFSGGLTNAGAITSTNRVGVAIGTNLTTISTFSGGFTNSGTITAHSSGAFVINVHTFSGGMANTGTISSAAGSGMYAFTVSTFAGGMTNTGTITAGGGWGMYAQAVSAFSGGMLNTGTITAGTHGIAVFNVSTFLGGITNTGTIAAAGTALFVSGVSTLAGGITNTGTISGAHGIFAFVSTSVSLFDSGTIIGTGGNAITFGTGPNTLTLGPGFNIQGNVVGSGTDILQLGGTGSGNFNLSTIGPGLQYLGFTTFNVVGGTWNTTGTFGQSQAWNVLGGTLAGTGTFQSINVANGGTLEPGTPGVPGTFMTVNGNLTFQPGAIYAVQLSPTMASRVNVAGAVSLAGAVQGFLAPGTYSAKMTYDILDPTSITGKFTGFTAANAPGFTGTLTYNNPTDVLLTLTMNLGLTGMSGNQQSTATAINNAFNNGATLPAGFFPLTALTGGNLATALNQINGEASTGAERSAFQSMDQFLNLMLDPFVDGRNGWGPGRLASGYAPEDAGNLPPAVARAYNSVLKAPPVPGFEPRWNAWGAGFGGSSTANGDPVAGSHDITAQTFGVAAGLDYHVSPDTLVGFALAGGGTDWGLVQALGGGRSDAFQAGIYGKTFFGPAYLAADFGFANHWFTTTRTAFAGDALTAKFDGQSYGGRLEGGYRFAVLPTFGVTPYAAVQVQSFHTPSYSETDITAGGFGLSYGAQSATDTRGEVGARFDDWQIFRDMPVVLRGRIAWAHDWVSNPALSATFQALPTASFIVNGAPIPKDAALTSAGAEWKIDTNWSFAAKFDGEFASGAQTYAGTGTLRYAW